MDQILKINHLDIQEIRCAFNHKAVDIPANNFFTWWWSHGYDGYDYDKIPESYSNDFKEDHPSMPEKPEDNGQGKK
jgi:hypothetical protein